VQDFLDERLGERLVITPRWQESTELDCSEINPSEDDRAGSVEDEELAEEELIEELERTAASTKAIMSDAFARFRPLNRYDRIDPRLDPRPPVGPVAGNEPHLRILGRSDQHAHNEPQRMNRGPLGGATVNYKRIEEILSWQKENSRDPYTCISDDPNHPRYHDPLSWEVIDHDRSDDWDEL
jgi:hypothetical protein